MYTTTLITLQGTHSRIGGPTRLAWLCWLGSGHLSPDSVQTVSDLVEFNIVVFSVFQISQFAEVT